MHPALRPTGDKPLPQGTLLNTSRPLSRAFQHACIERAWPPRLLAQREYALMSLEVRRDMALADLVGLVVKIGKSKSSAFKVKGSGSGHPIQISNLGYSFLELFAAIGWALCAPPEVRFDPRIEIIVAATRARNLGAFPPDSLKGMMSRDPWAAASVLNGLFDEVRHEVNTRAFMHRLQRHRDKYATRLSDLTTYFKQVAKLHPSATVLQLELRKRANLLREGDLTQRYAVDLSQWLAGWLGSASAAYGEAIVGNAWKIDYDVSDGFFAHIVLVVDGPQPVEIEGMTRALVESWRSMCGPGAYLEDCKGPGIELEYRGRKTNAWSLSLEDELRDVAIFLASTDSLFGWDYGGNPAHMEGAAFPRRQPARESSQAGRAHRLSRW